MTSVSPQAADCVSCTHKHSSLSKHVFDTCKRGLAQSKEILADLKNYNLLPLKILWFLEMAGIVAIWPYTSQHMANVGLNKKQLSQVQSASRLAGAVSPFLVGLVNNKVGKTKTLVALMFVLEAIGGASVLLLPLARRPSCSPQDSTVGVYAVLRVIYGVGLSSSFTLLDAVTLWHCQVSRANYGLQRVWGTLAALTFAPLVGKLVEMRSQALSNTTSVTSATTALTEASAALASPVADVVQKDYRLAFLALPVLRACSLLLLCFVDTGFTGNVSKNLLRDTWRLLSSVRFLAILPVPVVIGVSTGCLETHIYAYLESLGFGTTLISSTISIGSVSELLFLLIFVGLLSSNSRRVFFTVIAMLIASARYFGLQFLSSGWAVLGLEALDGVTGGLLVPALMLTAISLVPENMMATARGIMGTVLFGISPALGAYVSGFLVTEIGYRWTFCVFSLLILTGCAVFVAAELCQRSSCYQTMSRAVGQTAPPAVQLVSVCVRRENDLQGAPVVIVNKTQKSTT